MLERLSQQGAFVRRWPDGSYRIHDVYRDFLKARVFRDPQRAHQGHRQLRQPCWLGGQG